MKSEVLELQRSGGVVWKLFGGPSPRGLVGHTESVTCDHREL